MIFLIMVLKQLNFYSKCESGLGGLTATDFTIPYHLSQAGLMLIAVATPPTAYIGVPNE
jgi:hypothetical protein